MKFLPWSGTRGGGSLGGLVALLRRCSHPDPSVREEALASLLHPPVADEASFTRDFLIVAVQNPWLIRHIPLPAAELLLDVVGLTGALPGGALHADFLGKFLNRLPKRPFSTLLDKAVLLRPLLPLISVRLLQARGSPFRGPSNHRWRLLRRRLLDMQDETSATTLTLRDLKALIPRKGRHTPARNRRSLWLLAGRALTLREGVGPSCCRGQDDPDQPRTPPWGKRVPEHPALHGHSPRQAMELLSTGMWGAIERAQADELAAVRGLARAVSERTRRVVLSLHNATLAAAGGWAFEDPLASVAPAALRKEFARAVRRRMKELAIGLVSATVTPETLWVLWRERLVVPLLSHGLWESRVRATLDPGWTERHQRDLRLARLILGGALPPGVENDATRALPAAVAPHQKRSVAEILQWCQHRERLWSDGFLRLAACIIEGQKLLASGCLDGLVLPWIDKFFISSRREADWEYLPLVLQCLDGTGALPLVLFWEDTAHAADPSFKLALKGMRKRGHAFRGIGVFDEGTSRRDEALDIICAEHHTTRLFALRPLNDAHNPLSLNLLLAAGTGCFLAGYDSSWKDNLCFIYAGTQVAPLISVQCDMEPFRAWVVADHRKVPFGTVFRRRLRHGATGCRETAAHPLSLRYAQWANLL